jgi:gliding motility-associated-like protein
MLDSVNINIYSKTLRLSNLYTPLIDVCSRSLVELPFFTSDSPQVDYSWTNSNTTIGLPSSGKGQISPFTAADVTSAEAAVIIITPIRYGKIGVPYIIRVKINKFIEYRISRIDDITLCGGSGLSMEGFISIPKGAEFNWKNNNTGIGLPAKGEGNIDPFTTFRSIAKTSATITVSASRNHCPADSMIFLINLRPSPVTGKLHDTTFCSDREFVIKVNDLPAPASSSWQAYSNDMHLIESSTGNITFKKLTLLTEPSVYTIKHNSILDGCFGEARSFAMTLLPSPVAMFKYNIDVTGAESPMNTFRFTNQSVNAGSFRWDFNDGTYSDEKDPEHSFFGKDGLRTTLIAINNYGCSDSFRSVVYQEYEHIFIPNAFSPGNINEVFMVYTSETFNIEYHIYTRWGQEVFSTTDNEAWNGTFESEPCESGTYFYTVNATGMDKTAFKYSGTLTLLR